MTRHQFFLILALLLTACAPSVADRAHDRAGELMQEYPDSALAILSSLDSAAINTDARRARHALYTLCARNKQGHYIDSADAPQINIFQAYYNGRKDATRDRMLASYYNALLILSLGLYGDGIIELLKTRDMALALDDKLQLGLIYRNIADAYTDMNDYKSALHNSTVSLSYFEEAGDSSYIPYATCDLANAKNNVREYEDALHLGENALRMGLENQDSNLIADAISIMGLAYAAQNESESAIDILTKLDSLGISHSDICDFRNLGFLYFESSDFEKAEKYSCILHEKGEPDWRLEYKLAIHRNDYKKASRALLRENIMLDSILQKMFWQDASLQISSHYNTQLNLADAETEVQRNKLYFLVVLSVLIILCMTFFILLQHRKKQLAVSDSMNRINELMCHIRENNINTAELNRQLTTVTARNELSVLYLDNAHRNIKEIFASQSGVLNQLCRAYYEGGGTSSEKNRVYREAMQQIDFWRKNNGMHAKLENSINKYFDNLIVNLRQDYPNLKEEDIKMYMYVVAGFSNCSIGVLFDKSTDVITRNKSKLRMKLAGGNNGERYLTFFQKSR